MPGRILPLIAVLAAGLAAATGGLRRRRVRRRARRRRTAPARGGRRWSSAARTSPSSGSSASSTRRRCGPRAFGSGSSADLPNQVAADQALVNGQIDGYPEYIGAILETVAHDRATPGAGRAAYRAVRAFEARRGLDGAGAHTVRARHRARHDRGVRARPPADADRRARARRRLRARRRPRTSIPAPPACRRCDGPTGSPGPGSSPLSRGLAVPRARPRARRRRPP